MSLLAVTFFPVPNKFLSCLYKYVASYLNSLNDEEIKASGVLFHQEPEQKPNAFNRVSGVFQKLVLQQNRNNLYTLEQMYFRATRSAGSMNGVSLTEHSLCQNC
jgi:hypothetical protein